MSRVPSAPVPVHTPGRTVPSGRLLRACCAAIVMMVSLPCATTAAESALRPPVGVPAAASQSL